MKAFETTLWRPGEPTEPGRKSLTPAELTERLYYLEKMAAAPSLDNIPVAELQRKLEMTWLPDPATLLPTGGITTDLLNIVKGTATGVGTGAAILDIPVTDGYNTTQKYAIAMWDFGSGTFGADFINISIVSRTSMVTTFRTSTKGGGAIPVGQTVVINYWIWK